ncbi:MAG: hypothetical protein HY922_10915, partial [Elusimicrobia bacterium]|nr:hypothetical protein [Elusimicrobiota bacterium]
MHWDVTAVSTGDYQLMAAATDISGVTDPSPPSIVVSVSANPADCDINETSLGAGMVLKQQVVHNSVENTIAAADEGSKQVTKVVIPAEALDANARAVGMGGAYTALARDSNALLYNPAGLGLVDEHEATFMHNEHV